MKLREEKCNGCAAFEKQVHMHKNGRTVWLFHPHVTGFPSDKCTPVNQSVTNSNNWTLQFV